MLMLLFKIYFVIMKYGQDGAPDTGGTLKIYGEALRKEVLFTIFMIIIVNDGDDSSSPLSL